MRWCCVLFVLVGCADQSSSPQNSATQNNSIEFTEINTSIATTHCGSDNPTQILEVNGTGLALIDYDKDGDVDLFVVNASNQPCRLYENTSTDSIEFLDVTESVGIDVQRWATGVAVGDANGDGFDDLYITCHGPNVLLMNNQGVSFVDQTTTAGVGDSRWGTSARFGDLDNDGDLDLYLCNYLEFDQGNPPPRAKYKGQDVLGGPYGLTPEKDFVFENIGNGVFQDVTKAWGFARTPTFSLNATILDFTGDGLQDVFVGNDSMANNLFVNTGETPTRFEDRGLHAGVAANGDGSMQATMGIAIADVNGNKRPDIFTTNFSSDTNTLHTNDASGYFDDRTKRFGLGIMSRSHLGWSCGFHDFDLDGDEDLFIVNGHVYPEASLDTMDSPREQTVLLLERVGDRYIQIEQEQAYRDRSAVFGDLDSDGDIDIIVGQRGGDIRVLRNDTNISSPLFIKLQGGEGNPNCLGASMHVTLDDGTVLSRWLTDGAGFQSSSTPTQLVLPEGRKALQIDITWPDGEKQLVTDIPEQGLFVVEQPIRP